MFHSPGQITECLLASAQPPSGCPGVPALGGIPGGGCAGKEQLRMPRNGVKNIHGPVSGFQPRALFSGKASVGNEWNFTGRLQSGHWVTPAHGRRGHSWCHIRAVTELCPSGEQGGRCPLQSLTPRVLELPPQFPSLPFLTRGSCHVHPLTCRLQRLFLGCFVVLFFFQAELNQHHPIAPGVHPHRQHLNIYSLICRTQPTETFIFHLF